MSITHIPWWSPRKRSFRGELVMDTEFVERIYGEVAEVHESLPETVKERGFAIFYNPPVHGGLLLIGLNPRREDASYAIEHPEAHQGPPPKHLYLEGRGGNLGAKMRTWFDAVPGGGELLRSSNKVNAIFFGSAGEQEWKRPEFWGVRRSPMKAAAEARCREWVRQIVSHVEPCGILVEGMSAFDRVRADERLKIETKAVVKLAQQRVAIHAIALGSIPLLAIAHPSNAHLTKAEARCREEELFRFLQGFAG